MKNYRKKLNSVILLVCVALFIPTVSSATPENTQLNQQQTTESFSRSDVLPLEKKGNILNIILDKAPAISTERGTLVIEAFHDLNKNQQRDDSEPNLYDAISCTLDDIDYLIPAFIPALDYNARYKISCQGTAEFQPTINQKNVLIARRGQIISMVIPCQSSSPKTVTTPK
ncbi:MAG: hypothetical protein BA874_02005 [Desulfuromonadales bacterium C00003068]|jgi:hypothetical protein|nr:MAG: hypothetical protein BA874_02005 [Desulfuromonadales bacterium C00003068]